MMLPKQCLAVCLLATLGSAIEFAPLQVGPLKGTDTSVHDYVRRHFNGLISGTKIRVDRQLTNKDARLDIPELMQKNKQGKVDTMGNTAASRRVNKAYGYDCYSIRIPLEFSPDDVKIEVDALEVDKPSLTSKREKKIKISKSVKVSHHKTATWKMETWDATTLGTGGKFEASLGPVKGDISVNKQWTITDVKGTGGDEQRKVESEIKVETEDTCEAWSHCSPQMWTFKATITGHCPEMPIVNTKCWTSAIKQKNNPANDGIVKYLNEAKILGKNVYLAAVHGRQANWNKLGDQFFSISGSQPPVGVQGTAVDGIYIPGDKWQINYKRNNTCDFVTPVYDSTGDLMRMSFMVQEPIKKTEQPNTEQPKNGDKPKRAEQSKTKNGNLVLHGPNGVKYVILEPLRK